MDVRLISPSPGGGARHAFFVVGRSNPSIQVKNKKYGKTESFEGENFPSDVFLVFGNRLLAMMVAAAMVMLPLRQEPPGGWTPQVCMYVVHAYTVFFCLLAFVGCTRFWARCAPVSLEAIPSEAMMKVYYREYGVVGTREHTGCGTAAGIGGTLEQRK